jgi:hypothetical protein
MEVAKWNILLTQHVFFTVSDAFDRVSEHEALFGRDSQRYLPGQGALNPTHRSFPPVNEVKWKQQYFFVLQRSKSCLKKTVSKRKQSQWQ